MAHIKPQSRPKNELFWGRLKSVKRDQDVILDGLGGLPINIRVSSSELKAKLASLVGQKVVLGHLEESWYCGRDTHC